MAIVYNPLDKDITTKAFGNWFTFKPKKQKLVDDGLARWLREKRVHTGLVLLPPEFEDLEYAQSAEGKKILQQRSEEGRQNYIRHLRSLVRNVTVSLKADMETRNQKGDPAVYASDAELAAMQELAGFQKSEADSQKHRSQEYDKLLKELNLDK